MVGVGAALASAAVADSARAIPAIIDVRANPLTPAASTRPDGAA